MATPQEIADILQYQSALNADGGRGTMARARKTLQNITSRYSPAEIAAIESSPEFQQYIVAHSEGGSGFLGGLWSGISNFAGEAGVKEALMLAGLAAGANAAGMFGTPSAAGAGAAGATGATSGVLTAAQMAGPVMSVGYTAPAIATTGMLGGVGQAAEALAKVGVTPEVVAANASNPGWLESVSQATGLDVGMLGTIASTGLNIAGGVLSGQSATEAAQTSANAQIEAARIAAEASKFKPVGVTTRFGQSQFGYDPQGNLISAGYQLSPELKAQQDALMGISGQALGQYQGAMGATAPLGAGAQQAMTLGQGYLATTPQQQAAQYMAEQQALLAPTRERELAALQAQLQAQGRGGLAMGGTTTGMMASQPQLEALYNAQRMQDLQLAAQATQGGMDYAKFGAGMLGVGGDLQKQMYGTQAAAYTPYQTALGGAQSIEQLGQQPMDIGTAIGAKTSTAAAQAGLLQAQGMQGAATTMQPANAYSPWGAMLTGAGQAVGQYGQPQQQPKFAPYTGQQIRWGA